MAGSRLSLHVWMAGSRLSLHVWMAGGRLSLHVWMAGSRLSLHVWMAGGRLSLMSGWRAVGRLYMSGWRAVGRLYMSGWQAIGYLSITTKETTREENYLETGHREGRTGSSCAEGNQGDDSQSYRDATVTTGNRSKGGNWLFTPSPPHGLCQAVGSTARSQSYSVVRDRNTESKIQTCEQ